TNLDVYSNGTLYSRVVKVNDEDWYRITVPPFGTVNFHTNFVHADGDIDMYIHDACGGVLASSTGTTDNENISWTNPNNFARDIRLRVFLYNDTRNIYYLDFSRYGVSAPGNDTCSSPTPVTVGNDYFGTTFAANANGAASCGSSNASPDVYYTIVPSCSQDIVIDTFGSAFDTVLSVTYIVCGSADPWVEFDCNDDAAGTYQSQVSFPGTAGTTYYIRVSGYNGAYGTFNLHVRGVASVYDSCASAPYLDSNGGTAMWSNCTASTDGPPDDICLAFGSNQIYRDIWYTFVAPCAGTIDLNTFGSNFDTKIAVYANPDNSYCPPGPNSALVCNDDINSALESQVVFNTVPGQRYMYRVGSYSATATTNLGRLTATFTPNCGPVCDSIDYNADGLFPDTLDIDDFLSVFSGGPCSNDPVCADIDFNNDGLFPDTLDIDSLLSVFSGGPCL
ncbi:MAG TPA: hypothetical protein VHN77_08235, partial [Phycisphaerales bacterium]|nr:hypothetical protein [Phycisphaerales bacterium]